MARILALGAVLACAAVSEAQLDFIYIDLQQVGEGRTTNDLVYSSPFDVYEIVATNPNVGAVTSLEIDLAGNFLGTGLTAFKTGAANPVIFGFEAPDSFFVLPEGTDPADVLAVNTVDTSTQLATSYTVAGGADLIPGGGVPTTIVTVSVPAGTPYDLPLFFGRAAIGGVFVDLGCGICPEPGAGVLAMLATLGAWSRRRA